MELLIELWNFMIKDFVSFGAKSNFVVTGVFSRLYEWSWRPMTDTARRDLYYEAS